MITRRAWEGDKRQSLLSCSLHLAHGQGCLAIPLRLFLLKCSLCWERGVSAVWPCQRMRMAVANT